MTVNFFFFFPPSKGLSGKRGKYIKVVLRLILRGKFNWSQGFPSFCTWSEAIILNGRFLPLRRFPGRRSPDTLAGWEADML